MSDKTLGPQFLYHGTTREIEGQILPAKVHGGQSYWGATGGDVRGEASEDYAWAHPHETKTWDAAMDRTNFHYQQWDESNPHPIAPRARVYAVHPNENQSPGNDVSMAGEIKSTHFKIAHPIDIMPGHQGTFPEVNWNEHVKADTYLPGDEDANHPSHLSVQFGHHAGVWGQAGVERLHEDAKKEDIDRWLDREHSVVSRFTHQPKPDMIPGMSTDDRKYMRPRR